MVWAWRAGRARRMARWYDHLLTLLPFEPPYFERVGLACTYVGHPVIDSGADRGDAARFRAAHGIAADELVLTVLPGSRGGEVRRLLPIFGEALRRLEGAGRAVSGCRCRPWRTSPRRSPLGCAIGRADRSCVRGDAREIRRLRRQPRGARRLGDR